MITHVYGHRVFLSKQFPAEGARIRPVIGVGPTMNLEALPSHEAFTAILATERFLARVRH